MEDRQNASDGATSAFECVLSSSQQRLWFMQQLHPGNAAYNVPMVWRIQGALDVGALRSAIDDVVARHEILRTRFVARPGGPVQLIDEFGVRLVVTEASGMSETGLRYWISAEAARAFDLERGTLRAHLLRCAQDVHILLLTLHHIVCDGWSISILNRELGNCYSARVRGTAWAAEGPRLQYADVAAWEQEHPPEDIETQVGYWSQTLRDYEDLRLPADLPRPPVQSTKGASLPMRLDRHATGALYRLAAAESATPFMVLSAAFAALLSRLSGQQRFVLGSPIANRESVQTQDCVGPFASMLIVPADCSENPSFQELIARTRESIVTAISRQHGPFERIVAGLERTGDLSRHPIFQVTLAYQNVPDEPLTLPGLLVEPVGIPKQAAMFDLSLFLFPLGEEIAGSIEYSTDLFRSATVRQVADYFTRLLASVTRDPGLRLAEIPLAGEAWAIAGSPAPDIPGACRWVSVVDGLRGVVDRWAGRSAVESGGVVLSFGELWDRVDSLAGCLRSAGVVRGDRVGIVASRGVGLVVAVWGVWRAGAAFVPLDPGLPAARAGLIVADAGVSVVVVPAGGEVLPDGAGGDCRVVRLAADGAVTGVAGQGAGAAVEVTVADAAYVLFTSGSTGRPKGVVVDHGGVAGLAAGLAGVVAPGAEGPLRVSVNASLAFDACVQQLVQLAAGHCLVMVDEAVRRDPEAMAGFVRAAGVDVLDCTPTQLRGLVRAGMLAGPGAPSVVLVGGEAIDQRLWDELRAAAGVRVVNVYGLTECSVDSLAAVVADAGPLPSVGWPLAGVRAFVVDAAGRLAGPGVTGELWLGGPGVAQGYLGDPGLTATRFVPDGFGGDAGSRLLRTGDLVRCRADGPLEFVGRADRQVKVRGYRVELGEIEQALLAHPAVAEAAATARPDSNGNTHITAYARIRTGAGALRQWLLERLPRHAMPRQILTLESFPVTASGKIDYASLPEGDEETAPLTEYAAPSTAAEELLAGIWSRVLHRREVGMHDNFFDLGGDSILSLQITAQAREAGLAVTTRQIFELPTIARLARVAKGAEPAPATPRPLRGPLSPAQEWFVQQGFAQPNHWNMVQALALPEEAGLDAVQGALAFLLTRHEALRTWLLPLAHGYEQRVSAEVQPQALELLDLSLADPREYEARTASCLQGLHTALNLESGPLLRALLVDCGSGERKLVLVAHHTAVDLVSWRILADDLACFFARDNSGLLVPPPSFLAWSARMAETASSDPAYGAWWAETIPGEVAPLPVDHPEADDVEGDQRVIKFTLSHARTSELREAGSRLRAHDHELVLAAFAAALCEWSGENGVLIDIERHGREELFEDLDMSRTVGWFTSLFPVWIGGLSEDPVDALIAVKGSYRVVPLGGALYGTALRHGPYADLLAAKPQAQVVFNYHGYASAGTSAGSAVRLEPGFFVGTRAPANHRPHVLAADVRVEDGQLTLYLAYGARHLPQTAERLASAFDTRLGALAAAASQMRQAWVPEDFPLADLSPRELQVILDSYDDIDDIFALTPTQEGLLFHSLLEPAGGLYVEQRAWTFTGNLDLAALTRSWDRLGARYPVFRTAFRWQGLRSPVQIVSTRASIDIAEHDWSALAPAEQEQRISDLLAEDQLRPFDLQHGRTMRISVVILGSNRWMLIWTAHHLLLDGWSNAILVNELFAAYAALLNGENHVAPARLTMKDFVRWQRRLRLPGAEAYWRERLESYSTPTPLNLRPPADEAAGFAELTIPLPPGMMGRLKQMVQRRQLTLNTVVEGAWAVLLARYAGEQDVVFGTVSAGRPPEMGGIEDLIGLCITTQPLRVSIDPRLTVADWLSALQAQQVRRREFEHTSLVEVQGYSGVPRGQSLFDTLLVFENYPSASDLHDSLISAGLTMEEERIFSPVSYTVRCCFIPGQEARVVMGFHRDRVNSADVEHMGRQLVALLDEMSAQPGALLGNLRLLPALGEPDPSMPLTAQAQPGVPELVLGWSARRPEAVAVSQGADVLSYAQLGNRLASLADALRDSGLNPGDAVAVTGAKSAGLVTAMLGVLHAGCVMVPIDPGHVEEHQRALVSEAGCRAVVSVHGETSSLGLPTFTISPSGELYGSAVPATRTRGPYGPDVAYIMFTSGTTGAPKGVVGSHQGLSHFLLWQRHSFDVGPGDVTLQLTRLAFDVVLRDVFLPLISGATLALPASHDALAPDDVIAALERHQVTVLHIVPSLVDYWLSGRSPRVQRPSALRIVFFAGEPLSGDVVRRMREFTSPDLRVINLYGPTETTLAVCAHEVPASGVAGVVPLGWAIPGSQVLVLDEDGHRTRAAGERGELVIRSPYRSHGYLNQAEPAFRLNRFRPDAPEHDLLYYTGDLGRRRPDGSLEFLGRADREIKIRGVRVDLLQVAEKAVQHPGVSSCVVAIRSGARGEKILVGYVIASDRGPADHASVRDFLRRELPPTHVPGVFMTLTEFPRLLSGKVDVNALPEPVFSRGERPSGYVAPVGPLQQRLSELWAECMHLDQVGATDDFFELGGHSLIATSLASCIREELGIPIPLRVLFESPTVRAQAEWIEAIGRIEPEPGEVNRAAVDEVQQAFRMLQELPEDVRAQIMGDL